MVNNFIHLDKEKILALTENHTSMSNQKRKTTTTLTDLFTFFRLNLKNDICKLEQKTTTILGKNISSQLTA